MNTVGNITYKDNEHLAVKCIVLHSLGMDDGVLFGKRRLTKGLCKHVWVSGDQLHLCRRPTTWTKGDAAQCDTAVFPSQHHQRGGGL